MKKLVFAVLAVASLSVYAQDTPKPKAHIKGAFISAPARNRPSPVVTVEQSPVQGILPRATRVDNPFQLLNPFAPREYGNGSDCVSGYNDDPGQGPKNQKHGASAFKLLSFEF